MRVRRPAATLAVGLSALGLAALGLTTLAAAAPAALATPRADRPVIGGPLLASRGVIVRPGTGTPALPPAGELPASSWMVSDLTTGQVLAAKDPHGRFLPASTLKTLTAVTLIPRLDPSTEVTASVKDVSVDGTRVGLVPGQRYTVHKLFQCLLIDSANDAADALAQTNGGIPTTLAEMNAEARHLQADDTVAETPSGLDARGESTSAYDLTLIAKQGLSIPDFRDYISTIHTAVPAPHHKHFAIYTHNYLLTTYRGDIGVKNGYTVAAGGTDVQAATRHGQTIVVTLMHANPDFWPMARSLLDWGFAAAGTTTPIGQLVGPVTLSTAHAQDALHHVSAAPAAASTQRAGTNLLEDVVIAAVALLALAVLTRVMRVRRRRRPRYRTRW